MYEVIKSVIDTKNYELRDMLKKIDTMWLQGSISDAERAELIAYAQSNAQVGNSIDLLQKVEELDKRVKALEDAILNGDKEDSEDGTESITYPEYEVGKWYYAGDVVMFEGVAYVCIAPEGVVCTWSPSEYPDYWQEYVEA